MFNCVHIYKFREVLFIYFIYEYTYLKGKNANKQCNDMQHISYKINNESDSFLPNKISVVYNSFIVFVIRKCSREEICHNACATNMGRVTEHRNAFTRFVKLRKM